MIKLILAAWLFCGNCDYPHYWQRNPTTQVYAIEKVQSDTTVTVVSCNVYNLLDTTGNSNYTTQVILRGADHTLYKQSPNKQNFIYTYLETTNRP
jgi:hypothetical protein